MDERAKELWTAALRSGEYEQGRDGMLRQAVGSAYRDCCLGVLCDLFANERPSQGRWVNRHGSILFQTAGGSELNFLPPEVQQWAGLGTDNPELGEYRASEWNDGEAYLDEDGAKATFADIAYMVERYL